MKNLLLIMIMAIGMIANAQDRFTSSLNSMIVNEKDSFSIGLDIEYQGNIGYVRAGFNLYTDFEKTIPGETTTVTITENVIAPEINASIGFNIIQNDFFSPWRVYTGAYVTWFMVGGNYKSAGPELGVEHYFKNTNFFVGLKGIYAYSDLPLHYYEKEGMVLMSNLRIGITW